VDRPAALIRAPRAFTTFAAGAAICGALAPLAGAGAPSAGAGAPSAGVGAAPAGARWTPPAEISAATSTEVLGPQISVSPTGAAAVSFDEVDVDAQASAAGLLALAPPRGTFRAAQAVPGVQEILAVAFSGSMLELLTASGSPGQPCCATVQVVRRGASSGFARPQTIVTGVGGGATGRLVPLGNGRILAVIAGPGRLWVTEASATGPFAAARGLTHAGSAPAALAVTATPGGGSAVAWTQGSAGSVMAASAGPGATPSRPHPLIKVPPGHAVDGLQLAPRPAGLTIAWTESWNDAAGAYHSRAMAADLVGPREPVRPRALSAPGDIASALALASDGTGEEVAAWNVCSSTSVACVLKVKARRRGRARWFGATSRLGPIDPGQSPVLTMAADRAALLGWITGGRSVVAEMRPGATRFGPSRPMSGGLADNLALAYGPTGEAVATWTQGTFTVGVFAGVGR
jgi:hypothetical protein